MFCDAVLAIGPWGVSGERQSWAVSPSLLLQSSCFRVSVPLSRGSVSLSASQPGCLRWLERGGRASSAPSRPSRLSPHRGRSSGEQGGSWGAAWRLRKSGCGSGRKLQQGKVSFPPGWHQSSFPPELPRTGTQALSQATGPLPMQAPIVILVPLFPAFLAGGLRACCLQALLTPHLLWQGAGPGPLSLLGLPPFWLLLLLLLLPSSVCFGRLFLNGCFWRSGAAFWAWHNLCLCFV